MRRQANVRFALLASWLIFKRSSYLLLQANTRRAFSLAASPCGSLCHMAAVTDLRSCEYLQCAQRSCDCLLLQSGLILRDRRLCSEPPDVSKAGAADGNKSVGMLTI